MIMSIQELAPVVIVNRGALAAIGAGIGLLGAALVVVAGDFLENSRLMQWGASALAVGAILTILIPFPAAFIAGRMLEERGYSECSALTAFGFRFSRVAWVRDPSACVKPGLDRN